MTDNLNRTVAAVRAIFNKYAGCLGKSGSLAFLFDKKGTFTMKEEAVTNEETMTLAMIEAGAETVELEAGHFHITCPLENFGQVQQELETLQIAIDSASLQYVPNTSITLNGSDTAKVIKLINALEDHDDVQRAFHNMVSERALDTNGS